MRIVAGWPRNFDARRATRARVPRGGELRRDHPRPRRRRARRPDPGGGSRDRDRARHRAPAAASAGRRRSRLAGAGFTVVLAGRRREPLEEAAAEAGGDAVALAVRRPRSGVGGGALRRDRRAVRPARPAVQQRRHRRAAPCRSRISPSSSGRRSSTTNLTGAFLCTQAGVPAHEAPVAARRPHHQQRLDLGAACRARTRRPTRRPSTRSPA